jgi:putative transposase/transposase-like zinc-binding protein
MATVAEIVRRYGGAYLEKFGKRVPIEHQKVLGMIARCRTGELGTVVYRCEHCRRTHSMGRSCGNRHCPTCQQHHTKAWLEDQTSRLLPCPYFLLTFTLPASLRLFVRSHQQACYGAMFRASSATIRTLAADPKYIGSSNGGFFGVLHTWGRTLEYHPHIHYVVPGGGVSDDGTKWLSSRADFLIPVKAASAVYREKFREEMRREGLLAQIPMTVWQEAWVVDSQAVGDGRQALKYLAPYVFRVAISDRRITAIAPGPDGLGQVAFTYRKSGSQRWREMTVTAEEFLRRFLCHVLPCGFQKVRHYGFAAATKRKSYEEIRWLVTLVAGMLFLLSSADLKPARQPCRPRCAECGSMMNIIAVLRTPLLIDTS